MHKHLSRLPCIKLSILLLLLLQLLLSSGCGFVRPDYLKMVSPGELQQILIQDNVLLLDVHVPKQKHIPGTDHHIAFYRIDENAHLYPADKTTPIYLYCESGPMANWAARSLHNLGYRNLISLDGGTHAWEKAGFALQAEATP